MKTIDKLFYGAGKHSVTVLEIDECVVCGLSEWLILFGYDEATDTSRLITGFKDKESALEYLKGMGKEYKIYFKIPSVYTGEYVETNINELPVEESELLNKIQKARELEEEQHKQNGEYIHLIETTRMDYTTRTYALSHGVKHEDLTDEEKRIYEQSIAYEEKYEAEKNKRVLKRAFRDFERLRDIPRMPKKAIEILRNWTSRDDDPNEE